MKDIPILNFQYFQELHDKRYHVDIYSKPLMARLAHLHQHLIKYSANIYQRQAHYQDSLACLLSMANSLNMNIAEELSKSQQSHVVNFSCVKYKYHKDILIDNYKTTLGQMAKSLEGFDHVENISYRDNLKANIIKLIQLLLQTRDELDEMCIYSLEREYLHRIFQIKKNNIFYAFHRIADLADPTYRSFDAYVSTM